ncbi:hypothetical protein NQ317_016263 [Molorchus minor]|uniref:Uncharacterized protein n=1 Tax=Molorchus minor TaxID=1323400 RepID=A0ABQ9JYI4_9CUCU|nr:hypothetical protein NQ317_016263 [Molorchus minor]
MHRFPKEDKCVIYIENVHVIGRSGANILSTAVPMLHIPRSLVTVEVPGTSSNDSSLAVQHENEQISSQISTPVFSSHKIFEQEESQSSIVYTTHTKISERSEKKVPSRKTLIDLLRTIPFETEINRSIVDLLKTSVSTMDPLDRQRMLLKGFKIMEEMNGDPSFADKVMMFMARGIHKKWKQPIAYYFNEGGMKKRCPPKNTKKMWYEQQDLLGLNTTWKYTWRQGKNKIASWKNIIRLYELEDQDDDYKLCPKLTAAHIYNLKKMKVKMASQVFSARVAAAMRSLALHGQSDKMTEDALDTAEFILFMDKAFDSVNGARVIPESGKSLRTAVTEKSDHKEFWTEAIKVFESMVFLDSKMKEHITPSIKNWTHTLKALQYICTKLLGVRV